MLDSDLEELILYTPDEILLKYPQIKQIKDICLSFEQFIIGEYDRCDLKSKIEAVLGRKIEDGLLDEISGILIKKELGVNE